MIEWSVKRDSSPKKMSQRDFAKSLGIGRSTLAMMEVGKRDITERHIKTICAICNVDEHWFRTGKGEPFCQDEKSLLDRLAEEYGMTERERITISSFLKLSTQDRAAVMGYVDALVEKMHSTPDFAPALADTGARAEKKAKDWTDAELHAELDRQLAEQREAKGNLPVFWRGNSETA